MRDGFNPYDVLKLPRDATPDQVKAAHRRAVKVCHPDIGGDQATFARVQLAYDILMDPARRAKFDRDGTVDQGDPENPLLRPIAVIANTLDRLVGAVLEEGSSVSVIDMRRALLDMITAEADTIRANVEKTGKIREAYEEMAKRFALVAPVGQNLMLGMIDAKMRNIDGWFDKATEELASCEQAKALLADYRYNFLQRVQPGWTGWGNPT